MVMLLARTDHSDLAQIIVIFSLHFNSEVLFSSCVSSESLCAGIHKCQQKGKYLG